MKRYFICISQLLNLVNNLNYILSIKSQPIAIEGCEIADSFTSSSVNYVIVISRFLKGIEIYFLSLHGTNIIKGSQLKVFLISFKFQNELY
jgi:hypothetical protein